MGCVWKFLVCEIEYDFVIGLRAVLALMAREQRSCRDSGTLDLESGRRK